MIHSYLCKVVKLTKRVVLCITAFLTWYVLTNVRKYETIGCFNLRMPFDILI